MKKWLGKLLTVTTVMLMGTALTGFSSLTDINSDSNPSSGSAASTSAPASSDSSNSTTTTTTTTTHSTMSPDGPGPASNPAGQAHAVAPKQAEPQDITPAPAPTPPAEPAPVAQPQPGTPAPAPVESSPVVQHEPVTEPAKHYVAPKQVSQPVQPVLSRKPKALVLPKHKKVKPPVPVKVVPVKAALVVVVKPKPVIKLRKVVPVVPVTPKPVIVYQPKVVVIHHHHYHHYHHVIHVHHYHKVCKFVSTKPVKKLYPKKARVEHWNQHQVHKDAINSYHEWYTHHHTFHAPRHACKVPQYRPCCTTYHYSRPVVRHYRYRQYHAYDDGYTYHSPEATGERLQTFDGQPDSVTLNEFY